MELELHDAAVLELEGAYDWYLERDERVAAACLEAVRVVVERAARLPSSGPLVPGIPADRQVRRFGLAGFPYSVYVAPAGDAMIVVAVAHEHRRPGYWHNRVEP
jgi:plasmid stabilization system protein ParE